MAGKMVAGAGVGLFSLLVAFIAASAFMPAQDSSAITCTDGSTETDGEICSTSGSTMNINISNPYYITVTSSASTDSGISLVYSEASGTKLGDVLATYDTVTTTSNTGQTKYLYISTAPEASNTLTNKDTDPEDNRTYIAPGGGDTISSASALDSNTWGFALPSTTSGLPSEATFDESYDTVSSNSKFTKVPTLDSSILIQEEIGEEGIDEDTGEGTGEYISSANVYFGTLATTALNAGTYSSTIMYTAFTTEPPKADYMIDHDANGGYFGAVEKTKNSVGYDTTETAYMEKYSHTPNVSDAGVRSGNYPDSANLNDVVTISGASKLHVVITYSGESTSYDWATVWAGAHPDYTAGSNYSSGITDFQKLGGTTRTTKEVDVDGDSVTFGFKSDGSGAGDGYGYYAVITGYNAEGEQIPAGYNIEKEVVDGAYSEPARQYTSDSTYTFLGWSATQGSATAEFSDDDAIISYMSANSLKTITVYAVWQAPYTITWNANSGTPASRTTYVTQGEAFGELPTATRSGYYLAGWYTEASGGTRVTEETVPSADAIYYAHWTDKIITNLTYMQDVTPEICAATPTNTAAQLLDSRGYGSGGSDKTTKYGILKAEDGNCWMTDNLNLYNVTLQNAASDFDSGTFSLPASSNWSSNDYSQQLLHVADGTGQYASSDSKYYGQVYYNWCSAVAITNCNTTAEQDQSICPKNWKLPRGGTSGTDTTTNASWPKLINKYKELNGGTLTGKDLTTTDTSAVAYPLGFRLYYGLWYYSSQSERNQGSYGNFWSAKPNNAAYAYSLYYDSSSINPRSFSYVKGYGRSVRCVVPSS